MFERLLADLARALDAEALPYMVIGGQAVLLYGEPRLTRDVDLTLGRSPEALDAVLRVADAVGLRPLVDPAPFVAETLVLPCDQPSTGLRVNFVFSFSEYERHAIGRTRIVSLGGADVHFTSVEDLIVQKVVAGRPRDLDDVRNVLIHQPDADVEYVRDWLRAFGEALAADLLDTFTRLLRDARA